MAGFISEWWPESNRNGGRHQIGIPGRIASEFAEWADGEALAAHVGYGNDVFCTEDFGKGALGPSVLDHVHREWLTRALDVQFATLNQLAEKVAA